MSETCHWKLGSDGEYETSCANAYCFEYDFQTNQAGYTFCPGCGKKIKLLLEVKSDD